jgi:hypothetical protein
MDKLKVMIKISRTIIYLPFPLITEVEIPRCYRNLKLYTRISGRSFQITRIRPKKVTVSQLISWGYNGLAPFRVQAIVT